MQHPLSSFLLSHLFQVEIQHLSSWGSLFLRRSREEASMLHGSSETFLNILVQVRISRWGLSWLEQSTLHSFTDRALMRRNSRRHSLSLNSLSYSSRRRSYGRKADLRLMHWIFLFCRPWPSSHLSELKCLVHWSLSRWPLLLALSCTSVIYKAKCPSHDLKVPHFQIQLHISAFFVLHAHSVEHFFQYQLHCILSCLNWSRNCWDTDSCKRA